MGNINEVLETKQLNDLVKVVKPRDISKPKLTKVVINKVIVLLRDGELKSYGKIAKFIGFDKITKQQVKHIHRKMLKRLSELQEEVVV